MGIDLENFHRIIPDALLVDGGADDSRAGFGLAGGKGLGFGAGELAENALAGVFVHGAYGLLAHQRTHQLAGLAAFAFLHRENGGFVGAAFFQSDGSALRVVDPMAQGPVGTAGWVIVGDGADAGDTLLEIDAQLGALRGLGCIAERCRAGSENYHCAKNHGSTGIRSSGT